MLLLEAKWVYNILVLMIQKQNNKYGTDSLRRKNSGQQTPETSTGEDDTRKEEARKT